MIRWVICPDCRDSVDPAPYCPNGHDLRKVIAKAACHEIIPFYMGLTSSDLQFLKQHRISSEAGKLTFDN